MTMIANSFEDDPLGRFLHEILKNMAKKDPNFRCHIEPGNKGLKRCPKCGSMISIGSNKCWNCFAPAPAIVHAQALRFAGHGAGRTYHGTILCIDLANGHEKFGYQTYYSNN